MKMDSFQEMVLDESPPGELSQQAFHQQWFHTRGIHRNLTETVVRDAEGARADLRERTRNFSFSNFSLDYRFFDMSAFDKHNFDLPERLRSLPG